MNRLCLKQSTIGAGNYRIELEYEADRQPKRTAAAIVPFALSDQDQEDLRWYLEDYLQFPFDPAPAKAVRVEKRMTEIGVELFKALFQMGDDNRDLWAKVRDVLNNTRVEVVTEVQEAASIPWELLRDPKTDAPLALNAQAFVRSHTSSAVTPRIPARSSGPIRILLVICRPGGRNDVAFRSVARGLLKSLTDEARAQFAIDVLRPPTFEQLNKTLRQAKEDNRPYHIVHFDGHGLYGGEAEISRFQPSPHLLRRAGKHGYLAFENSKEEKNIEPVDGPALGKLLVQTEVPVLVLNACRSAHADLTPRPPSLAASAALGKGERVEGAGALDQGVSEGEGDVHGQVRALGSLAQEVIDAGVGGVVAMRYNVYVVTAAQFVADLYGALARGQVLGEAVSAGRKQLAAQPSRAVGYAPRDLQDWPVPVVYEAAPIALFPKPKRGSNGLSIRKEEEKQALPPRGWLTPNVPRSPDAGFFGRDETLLALDRAFDNHKIVLLHAFAGSGKTSTTGEFARWYAQTGGVAGPVLFTSFEQKKTLFQALNDFGEVFAGALAQSGVQWQALTELAKRREIALQVMRQVPILWIWDNVEPIGGFPSGAKSAWSETEQQELADFLRDARETKAKFLLTSRRDERSWLGDLPRRIAMPSMPMMERMLLAKALADKLGKPLKEVDWRPLLEFTEGNPLTVTVLVGQALRQGLSSQAQITQLVEELQAGKAAFTDDESQGRSQSLGASLAYGFKESFTEEEQKRLALLAFFQGFVDVDALRLMGDLEAPWHLLSVEGLDRESWIALLDRAAEIGLLTAYGGGYYAIHPALPWFFQSLLKRYYPVEASEGDTAEAACRAFVEAMGQLGSYYHRQYEEGRSEQVIPLLTREHSNLKLARQLARKYDFWRAVINAMQGLHVLYEHTGRRAEWAALVEEIVSGFVDLETEAPLSGREEAWSIVCGYQMRLAREARQWVEAERLERLRLEWMRRQSTPLLEAAPETLDNQQRNILRSLAISAHELGEILRAQSKPECIEFYEEAYALFQRIGDRQGEADTAFNLGHAYLDSHSLRDLNQAEYWYRYSLDRCDERDSLRRVRRLGQLGHVAHERYKEAHKADRPKQERLSHLNAALKLYTQSLDMLPANAIGDLAVAHHQLGIIFADARDLDRTVSHFREAIRYKEQMGDLYSAGQTRFNVAIALANAGRRSDALLYAQAALRNFETFGDRAASDIQRTQRLIEEIEEVGG